MRDRKHVAPPPAGFQGPSLHSTPSVVCRGLSDVPDGQRWGGLRGHIEGVSPSALGWGRGRSPPPGAGCWVGSGGYLWPGRRAGRILSGGHPLCGVLPAQGGPEPALSSVVRRPSACNPGSFSQIVKVRADWSGKLESHQRGLNRDILFICRRLLTGALS